MPEGEWYVAVSIKLGESRGSVVFSGLAESCSEMRDCAEGFQIAPSIKFVNIIAGFSMVMDNGRPMPDLFRPMSSSPSGRNCGSRSVHGEAVSANRTAFMAGLLSFQAVVTIRVI